MKKNGKKILTGKPGMTIIEVLIALVILVTVLIPISDSFSTFRTGFEKIEKRTVALSLAASVLEHIHYRLYNDDLRISDILESDTEKNAAMNEDSVTEIFDTFIDSDSPVASEPGMEISSYFVSIQDLTQSGDLGITQENDPDLFRQLKDYRCSVDVYYSTTDDLLDSDVDGSAEPDMAEIRVRIHWVDDGNDRFVELWTVYSSRQYIDVQ